MAKIDMRLYCNTENIDKPEFFIDVEGKCKLCKKDAKKEECDAFCPLCCDDFTSDHKPTCKCLGPKIKEECVDGKCDHLHHCIKCNYKFDDGKYCCKCSQCEKDYIWGKKTCDCDEGIITEKHSYKSHEDSSIGYYRERCHECDKVLPGAVVEEDDYDYDEYCDYDDDGYEVTPEWDRCTCHM